MQSHTVCSTCHARIVIFIKQWLVYQWLHVQKWHCFILLVHLKQGLILTSDSNQVHRWSGHMFWHSALWANIFMLHTHKLCAKERNNYPIHCQPSGFYKRKSQQSPFAFWPVLFTLLACAVYFFLRVLFIFFCMCCLFFGLCCSLFSACAVYFLACVIYFFRLCFSTLFTSHHPTIPPWSHLPSLPITLCQMTSQC